MRNLKFVIRRLARAQGAAVVVALAVSTGSAQFSDTWIGQWTLNVAKSVYKPGPPPAVRSQVITHEAVPNGIRTIVERIDVQGRADRQEITAMFDGKEYQVTGTPMPATRVYTRVDNRRFEYVQRVNGRVTVTTRVEISADGKTRTNTTTGTNPQGRAIYNVEVWERQ